MAFTASLNTRQENVRRVVTFNRLVVACCASHHAVCPMVEGSVFKPACANPGRNNLWKSVSRRSDRVALLAGLASQQPFGVVDPELHPFTCITRETYGPDPARDLAGRRLRLIDGRRISCDVFLKTLHQKCMHSVKF